MTNPLLDTDGLPRFADMSPGDVIPALSELIAGNRAKLNNLLENAPSDFESIVIPLETMEHELSRVWSPISHLQGVLGSPGWRKAYNEALPILTAYGVGLLLWVPHGPSPALVGSVLSLLLLGQWVARHSTRAG